MRGAKLVTRCRAIASVLQLAGDSRLKSFFERDAIAALEREQSLGFVGGEVGRRHVELCGGLLKESQARPLVIFEGNKVVNEILQAIEEIRVRMQSFQPFCVSGELIHLRHASTNDRTSHHVSRERDSMQCSNNAPQSSKLERLTREGQDS